MAKCTLEDLNFSFDYNKHCTSCEDGECHTILSTENGDFDIHLLAISRIGPFKVTVVNLNEDVLSITIEFDEDSECAIFLRDVFGFKCE